MMMMDPTLIVTLGGVTTFIFIFVCICSCSSTHRTTNEPENNYTNLDDAQIVKRNNIQEKMRELSKWSCLVCGFQNLQGKTECILCNTRYGENIPLGEMNSIQSAARKRKVWVRKIDEKGKLVWVKHDLQREGFLSPQIGEVDVQSQASTDRSSDAYLTLQIDLNDEVEKKRSSRLTFVNLKCQSKVENAFDYDYNLVQEIAELNFYEKYSWFLVQTESMVVPFQRGHIKLQVNRKRIYQDTFDVLAELNGDSLHQIWRITLIGEEGIDAGGVLREWYSLTALGILVPETGLFISNENNLYTINPNSAEMSGEGCHLTKFETFGKFLGRAIFDGQVLPFRFCIPFFKHMLGIPLTFSDLNDLDQDLYRSLTYIQNEEDASVLESLGLTFSVSSPSLSREDIDLKENGRNIAVTQENKEEYLHLSWKYYVLDRVAPQLNSILTGLYQVLPKDLLMVFDYKELELLICGFNTIDVNEWKINTKLVDENKNSFLSFHLVQWFFDAISELTEGEKAKFLQFSTGSPRLPVQGFEGLTSYDGRVCPFSIRFVSLVNQGKGQYIKSHSCFNRIDLPLYEKKEQLKESIRAIVMMDSYDFSME